MSRMDLAQFRAAKTLLGNRWPQFLLRAITLAGFIFTILAGLFGSVVGSHNFAIIFVWIAWWTALKLVFIPFGGRAWCSICPIPMPGEWIQRGGILESQGKPWGLNKRWPKRLKGVWLQAIGFLFVGLFGAVTLTSARVTAVVLAGIILLAFILALIFERRAFCNYLCPIGGFTGLYAQVGPVEVRVKRPKLCAAHSEKPCYEHCPWGQYPLALKSSANCGLCMECLRVCEKENIAVNLRPWGSDLGPKTKHRLDETFLGLVMLASALVDSAVFLGPWGALKMAAYTIGSGPWWIFASVFLGVAIILLPGLFALAVWIAQKARQSQRSLGDALAYLGQMLVPLGLMAWIAFTISFAFVKFGYVLPVVSDPLGLGWTLLGKVNPAGVGEASLLSLMMQVLVLAVGLFWSSRIARRLAGATRAALPLILFASLFTLAMLWLLLG